MTNRRIPLRVLALSLLLILAAPLAGAAEPVSIFDGKTTEGWEGDKEVWRVEDGALVGGSLKRKQEKNNFLCTTKEYANFELTLKIKLTGTEGFINSGIQIRSKRVPNHHEVSGYQADFGKDWDGALYDESRRNKVLVKPTKEALEKAAVKRDDWNDYRIRAEGDRVQLWLNGVQTVDYTETEPEEKVARKGVIALQIHGGATAEVYIKDLKIEELPPTKAMLKPPLDRLNIPTENATAPLPFKEGKFELAPNEMIVFAGPENMVIEQRTGWIEATIAAAGRSAAPPRFRHMGWEGDTVYRQNRMENWGSWKQNLDAVEATMVIAWFGQIEALDTTKTPEDFKAAYSKLLDEFAARTPRIVILAPLPFQGIIREIGLHVPDNTKRDAVVRQHAEIARDLAKARGYAYVDLYTPFSKPRDGVDHFAEFATNVPWTRDGVHLNDWGMMFVAADMANALGISGIDRKHPLRPEIVEKNRIWFDVWRCTNWAFAYGDRTTQPFAKATGKFPSFVGDLNRYAPIVAAADARVHAIARGEAPPAMPAVEPLPEAPPASTPDEQMKTFTLYPGFEVSLFADEKLGIAKPIQIRWDDRGRLWVLCVPSYPQLMPGQRANDYLLMLEDTDGDGRPDKGIRVIEGLTMPMGFEFGADGIYICESTQLAMWSDKDGDGKCETRSVVLSGFGTGDTHQMINSIRWGPDGCLWFTQGYHIWSYVETPHGIAELSRSGVWRLNPRTLKLDGFFNESTAGLNSWGVAFDEYGQVFHGGGADYSLFYTTPGMISTLHPLNYRKDFCVSRGKSMEPEFLHSRHLPDDLQGVLLKSTYFTSQVSLYRIADDGAGFKSTALPDLMASKTNDFRPVETRVGPDGAIYVCDWLNPIIGHYQASYRDPRRDRTHGRIWKLTATGRPLLPRPELEKMTVEQLLEQFRSPERWPREHARRILYNMPPDKVLPAAETWMGAIDAKDPGAARMLYEVSGLFCAHESPRAALIEKLLASSDFRLRCWGQRLVGLWAAKLPDALKLIERGATDEHPRVRMESVIAASNILSPESLKAATLVIDKPRDFYIDYALTQCVHALAPAWQPALADGKLDFGARTDALVFVLRAAGPVAGAASIRKVVADGRVPAEARDDLLAALVEAGGAADLRFALEQGGAAQKVISALEKAARVQNRKPSGDLAAPLEKLLADPEPAARAAGFRLAAAWKVAALTARARTAAETPATPPVERVAAIRALAELGGKDAVGTLAALSDDPSNEIRVPALSGLVTLDLDAAAAKGAVLIGGAKKVEMAALLKPFLQRKGGGDALAKAVLAKKPAAAGAEAALQWMAGAGYDEPKLRKALNEIASVDADERPFSAELVTKLVADAQSKGDAKRGEVLFKDQALACANCHKVGTTGGTIGPELTSVGRAMTPESIAESVLWPGRQVKEGFLLTLIATKDGRRFQGMKSAETPTTLTLRDTSGGAPQTFNKADLEKRHDAGTAMPEGLTDRLTPEQLADLLKFVMELK